MQTQIGRYRKGQQEVAQMEINKKKDKSEGTDTGIMR